MTQQKPPQIPNPFSDEFVDIPQNAVNIDNEAINKGHFKTKTNTDVEQTYTNTTVEEPDNLSSYPNYTQPPELETHSQPTQTVELPPKPKYRIVDLYWLPNWRLYLNQKVPQNEPDLVVLSYNATFSNLRIAFHRASEDSFTESAIVLNNTSKITTVNIFSETVEMTFNTIKTQNFDSNNKNIVPIVERLWKPQPGWAPNKSYFDIQQTYIRLVTIENKSNIEYNYYFNGWQYNAFINAMKILINGNSWLQSMNALID